MTPEDIELLFQSRKQSQIYVNAQDEDDDAISEQEKDFRVSKLKEVLLDVQNAWHVGSPELDLIAEKLGDGSRDGQHFFSHVQSQDRQLY